jgi:glycosyltransferase involved in cell wall biosynthesis
MKVSIVMPAYNAEKTIKESVSSVLLQTYIDFELIIINDGSNDDTIGVVQKYCKDPRIIIKSINNGGVANARNTGIFFATGDLVAFLDSDDIWDPNFLLNTVKVLKEDKDVDIVYTDYNIFTSNINNNIPGLQNRYKFIRNTFYRIMIYDFIPMSASVVRRSIFDDGSFFKGRFFGTEDWEFWINKIEKHNVKFIPGRFLYYREHDLGISKNKRRQTRNVYKVVLNTLAQYRMPNWVKYLILWEFKRSNILSNLAQKKYRIAFYYWLKMIASNPFFLPSYVFIFHAIYRKRKQRFLK